MASDTRKHAQAQNTKFTSINWGLKWGPEKDKVSHTPPCPKLSTALYISIHFIHTNPFLDQEPSFFLYPKHLTLPSHSLHQTPTKSDFMPLCTGYTPTLPNSPSSLFPEPRRTMFIPTHSIKVPPYTLQYLISTLFRLLLFVDRYNLYTSYLYFLTFATVILDALREM